MLPGHNGDNFSMKITKRIKNPVKGKVSSIWPQIWLILVRRNTLSLRYSHFRHLKISLLKTDNSGPLIHDFSNIMWIWCSISMVSMVTGLFLFPNQNLDQKDPNLGKNDSLASTVYYRNFKLKKESLKGRFRESLLYLKSPIFWVHLLMFSVGNCTIALGLVLIGQPISSNNLESVVLTETTL